MPASAAPCTLRLRRRRAPADHAGFNVERGETAACIDGLRCQAGQRGIEIAVVGRPAPRDTAAGIRARHRAAAGCRTGRANSRLPENFPAMVRVESVDDTRHLTGQYDLIAGAQGAQYRRTLKAARRCLAPDIELLDP